MTVRAILVAAPPGINRLFEQMPAAHEEANPLGCGRATTKLINRFVYALHRRQDKLFSLISQVALPALLDTRHHVGTHGAVRIRTPRVRLQALVGPVLAPTGDSTPLAASLLEKCPNAVDRLLLFG